MVNWTQRGELIFPVGLSAAAKAAIAQAYVDYAQLETLADELLMFEKAIPISADWGATETHRRVSTALFPALTEAIRAAIPSPVDGLWYVLNDTGELLFTNDPARLDGVTITHGLDWQQTGATYSAGEIARDYGQFYECIQPHTTQGDPNWRPSEARALWKKYVAPGELSEWAQPVGAHDVYPVGARVLFGGDTWVNTIPANVWQPGVTGWTNENAPVTPNWVYPHHYIGDNTAGAGQGDVVVYVPNGHRYRCRQTHDSIVTWTPVAVPALWLDLGPA